MTALPTIYITRYDRLIHSDLGGGDLLWHSIVIDI